MTFIRDIIRKVERLVSRPVHELSRAQWYMRYAVDLVRHCTRTMRRDRAGQMAAALTYRTIFSLVPLAVLSLIVLRAVYDQETATNFLQQRILVGLQVPATESETISNSIVEFTNKAYEVSGTHIGGVGILVLIWAALAMITTVEHCFNTVYNSPAGRPWYYRIPIYWATLTLGPVLIFVSLYLGAQLVEIVVNIPFVGSLLGWLTSVTPLAASWLLLFLLYMLMPNAQVAVRPALVGSFIAALLWESGKFGFQYYAANVSWTSIYGSLGLVPLFLFWIYITWLIVLFGLELAYTLQTLKAYQLREDESRQEPSLVADSRLFIPIMARIGREFVRGGTLDNQALAHELHLPVRTVVQMTAQLAGAGLIHQVQSGKTQNAGYALAMPPQEIPVAKLIELAGEHVGDPQDRASGQPEWSLLASLDDAQCQAAARVTLASLLGEKETAKVHEEGGKVSG